LHSAPRKPSQKLLLQSPQSRALMRGISFINHGLTLASSNTAMDIAWRRGTTDKRSVLEMVGEFMREAAVLVSVFMPLDMMIEGKPWTAARLAGTAVVSLALLAAGVTIERLRP
jgi:hypothetical protein